MSISTEIIADPTKLAAMENDLDDFVYSWSENPFLSSPFLKTSLGGATSTARFPIALIVKVHGKTVGLTSLFIHRLFGINYAISYSGWWCTPSIILSNDYSQVATEAILKTVFGRLGCRFAMLYLTNPWPHLENLVRTCKSQKKYYVTDSDPSISHAVLQIDRSWTDFLEFRGEHFKKRSRANERKLSQAGDWHLSLFENESFGKNVVYEKIVSIEKLSWKKTFSEKSHEEDSLLGWLLDSAKHLANNNSPVKLKVWLLELNNLPIAYTFECDYKNTAFIIKTSFAEKYKNLSPGFFVNNNAIKDLFEKREVRKIDFLSSFLLVQKWCPSFFPRMRVTVGDLSGIGLVKARLRLQRIVDTLYHSYDNWPYNSTAQEQMKQIVRPLDLRRTLLSAR